jgi:DNA-directed RNA polymerase specialized sigma24 family protein
MSKDLELANRICQELQQNNKHAALELMELYGKYLESYTRERVRKINLPEMDSDEWVKDLLQEFWITKILEEKVVCRYQGKNDASLKTFLFTIMYNLSFRQFKKTIRRRETLIDNMPETWEPSSPFKEDETNMLLNIDSADLTDDHVQEKLNRGFVDQALKTLSSERPEDARIISWRIKDDLTYLQIAQKDLEARGLKPDNDVVKKKAAALRQQCTRQKTGAFARFADIYQKILAEKGFRLQMIENMPILERAEP